MEVEHQWYYEENGEQQGPIDGAKLKELHAAGVVADSTRVWRTGMDDWVPYADALKRVCASCDERVDESSIVSTGGIEVCPGCKDTVLQRMREGVPVDQTEEYQTIRLEHIKHEASLRSVGALYYLGVAGSVFVILSLFMGSASQQGIEASILGIGVFYGVLGVALFFIGRGYRKLKSWVRIPGGIFAGIGLLGFPLGTLINAYILYLLFSKKGKVVLSPEYQDVIAATPHIKYKTSRLALVIVVLIVIFVIGGIFTLSAI